MVYGDRTFNQDPIANLNSTSPLNFTDSLSAEDLARDLDIFTNTQFFDFDFGTSSSSNTGTTFTPIESTKNNSTEGDSSSSAHISISTEPDLSQHYPFLSGTLPHLDGC